MKKLRQLLVVAITVMLMTTAFTVSFADSRFNDVPDNHEYADVINWAAEQGIVQGYTDGNFYPDNKVTVRHFCLMLAKATGKDLTKRDELAIAYDNDWINLHTIAHADTYTDLCMSELYNIVFKVFDHKIYAFEDNAWMAAMDVAKELGVIDQDADPHKIVTRAEALEAIKMAYDGDINVSKPDILDKYNIKVEDFGIDYNMCIKQVLRVPQPILDEFERCNWNFTIGHKEIRKYNEKYNTTAIGLTMYDSNSIYVNCPASVIHEFGHFLNDRLGYIPELNDLYFTEKNKDILGAHGVSNAEEFFAEFFANYIRSKSSLKLEGSLKTKCPNTYNFFVNLEANNWNLK